MLETIRKNLTKFFIIWFLIFLGSFIVFSALGLTPQEETAPENPISVISETTSLESLEEKLQNIPPALPRRVVAEKVGIDVKVNNPDSTKIADLDNSLLTGSVRYPESGVLGQKTNMLLFGHSSHLPIVRNPNFKAFNKIEKLETGDAVSIFSDTHEFIYKVTSVEEADAENALVVFDSENREVTLSTCDNFGNLNDRFVVKAILVDVILI